MIGLSVQGSGLLRRATTIPGVAIPWRMRQQYASGGMRMMAAESGSTHEQSATHGRDARPPNTFFQAANSRKPWRNAKDWDTRSQRKLFVIARALLCDS
jgi:hypothetical protein